MLLADELLEDIEKVQIYQNERTIYINWLAEQIVKSETVVNNEMV